MCEIFCNVALKCEAVSNFLQGKLKYPFLTKREAASITLCKYEDEYPKADCLNQECQRCGPDAIKRHFHQAFEKFGKSQTVPMTDCFILLMIVNRPYSLDN